MAILSLCDVSFEYPGGYLAVENVNLSIEKGENVAIVGQNGAGKTTTVKMCNRLLLPTRGDVIIDGVNTRGRTTAQVSRRVGYVFQNPDDQIFHSTICDEVAFGPNSQKLSEEQKKRRLTDALRLTGLADKADENPYDLPLSVRKFVTIASVIAMDTDVIIFDEPTAGQDLAGNERLRLILSELMQRGKTLITISHDMEFVAANFDRVVVMADKRVIADDTPGRIFWMDDILQKARLTQTCAARICRHLGVSGNITRMEDAVRAILEMACGNAGESFAPPDAGAAKSNVRRQS